MIRADDLTVRAGGRDRGRTLLDGVTFEAPTGTVTGIVGPNGSGKTTLLRALLRAAPAASGRVSVDGHDLRMRSRRWIARRIAVVGQRVEPDPSLSVADEVALGGLASRGVLRAGGASFDEEVADALAAVGLAGRAGAGLGTLSGGELQRVALARALAHGASHVLLDEPTNHLDVRHRLEIVGLLRRIAPTVVIVLHDLELAARICDRVAVLAAGRIVAAGPPAEVLQPAVLDTVYEVRTHVLPDPDGLPHFSFSLPVGSPRVLPSEAPTEAATVAPPPPLATVASSPPLAARAHRPHRAN